MNSVRLPSVLAGATALVLVTGSATFAQQSDDRQGQAAQGVAAQSQTEAITADESRGAAAQIAQQLEQARQAIEQGNSDDARDLLDQINDMVRQAAANGSEGQMVDIQAQLQQAVTALEKEDTEAALAALEDASATMQEIERAAATQGGQGGQQQSGQHGQQQAAEQQPGQQQAARDGQQSSAISDDAMSQEALWNAQDAIDTARMEIEAALRSVEEAAAALAQIQPGREGAGRVVIEGGQADTQTAGQAAVLEAEREVPRLSPEETRRLLGTGDRQIGEPAELMAVSVADMHNRTVVTFDGKTVGEIDRIVTDGDRNFAVIEHGGFLGIGESKVAIPADRLGMRGDEVVLLGLSEEQLESMPDYAFEAGQELTQEQSIEIGRYE